MGRWWAAPEIASTIAFVVGWGAGWVVFVRARRMPRETPSDNRLRSPVSVIIPCRDEAENLAALLPNLRSALRDGDEIIVVDDESTDNTSTVAQSHGAVVVCSTSLPVGWAGKSHACWLGASRAANDTLIFLDADVRLGMRAVDDLASLSEFHPQAVVSVMPWHRTVAFVEQLSMMFNVVSSMVASLGASRGGRRVAYGPFLAVRRAAYMAIGGHSRHDVRGAVVEDLALARAMPEAVAMVGRRGEVEYRMYPRGFAQLVEGWTKNTAIGAASVPRPAAMFIIAWIVSLCGGFVTSAWFFVASVVQVAIMARRVGNFGVLSALLYPFHVIVFVAVALRSLVRAALVGSVTWRGRSIATR